MGPVYSKLGETRYFFGVAMAQQDSLQMKFQSLFLDHDVEEIGKELGRGAYGVVYKVKVSGTVCAGKTLHKDIIQVHILANDEMIATSCYLFLE